MTRLTTVLTLAVLASAALAPPVAGAKEVTRPEEIRSMREVVYDTATYARLDSLWEAYDRAYPSEVSYANWMYAARYAHDAEYAKLLEKGLKKYPANPTLLYLKALQMGGVAETFEGRALLERAAALDPGAVEPWFSLALVYMGVGDRERLDVALRRILTSGTYTDEIIDYNYNVLASLEPHAILFTNGDNDTYPCWILTRIEGIRSDVTIVNRSLLNTAWYPLWLMDNGLPRFTDSKTLDGLRESTLARIKKEGAPMPPAGPFADTLVVQIVSAAERSGRPAYFAWTLYGTPELARLRQAGRDLGLVTLVTPSQTPYDAQLKKVFGAWLDSFRTGGLDSWRLRHAPETDAGRRLVAGYGSAIASDLEVLQRDAPGLRAGLFRWYTGHLEPVLTEKWNSEAAHAWCRQTDVPEIAAWCKKQGLEE
jgi:hypothetical protein